MSVNNNKRGSALIATLIVALITISIVGLFLRSIYQEINYAHRSRMAFQAVNLAESGLEYAIMAIQNNDWTGWQAGAKGYYRNTFSDVTNVSGNYETVSIQTFADMSSSVPKIISEGIIQSVSGPAVSRQIYIELGGIKSLLANGLVAKKNIEFNGQDNLVDSYFSSLGKYGEAVVNNPDNKKVGTHNISAGVSVATLSKTDYIFNLGNSDVHGSIATGGGQVAYKDGATLRNDETPGTTEFDDTLISRDFYGGYPDPTIDAEPISPKRDEDFSGKDELLIVGDPNDPYAGTTYVVLSENWTQQSKQTMKIYGHVVIIAEGNFDTSGTIELADPYDPSTRLEIYTKGSMSIGGNGIVNESQKPEKVMIYGVGDPANTKQEFTYSGNAALAAIVYAPSYDVTFNGGGSTAAGEIFGALVGNTVIFNGQYLFHYDEDLAELELENPILQVSRWIELIEPEERRNIAALLAVGL